MGRSKSTDESKIRLGPSKAVSDYFLLDRKNTSNLEVAGVPYDDLKKRNIDIAINRLLQAFKYSPSEEYTREKLSELANRIFPPKNPLPEKPPTLWSKEQANKYSSPAQFTEETYKEWFSAELSWPYLYKADRQLYNALRYHLKKNGIELETYLPTKSSLVKRNLEQAGPEGAKEAARLLRALERSRRNLLPT